MDAAVPQPVLFREVALVRRGPKRLPKIYLHSMPARFESWEQFLSACKDHQIGHILCLTSVSEIALKSPVYANAIATHTLGVKLSIIEVKDFSTPQHLIHYQSVLKALLVLLEQSQWQRGAVQPNNLLIHCAAGIGRTGCAAICLLKELGLDNDEAKSLVLQAGSGPETPEQDQFVNDYTP